MIVPIKKPFARVRRLCMLCALFGLFAVVAHAADYRMGTYRGASGVGIDPESGDRTVRVLPPPATGTQQQLPVYVYPQVDWPGQRPDRPGLPAWTDRPGQRPDRPGLPAWTDRPGQRPPYARPPFASGGRPPFGR